MVVPEGSFDLDALVAENTFDVGLICLGHSPRFLTSAAKQTASWPSTRSESLITTHHLPPSLAALSD